MDYRLIDDTGALEDIRSRVSSASRFALDCEAAGFHRYTDRLCLLQISTGTETLLLDPFALDARTILEEPLESRRVSVVMHGADYVSEGFIEQHGRLGRSFGCPAVPRETCKELVPKIADGQCLFIYHPDQQYFQRSALFPSAAVDVRQ